jgi:hypothetical protein
LRRTLLLTMNEPPTASGIGFRPPRAIEIFTGRSEGQKAENLEFALPPAVCELVFSF